MRATAGLVRRIASWTVSAGTLAGALSQTARSAPTVTRAFILPGTYHGGIADRLDELVAKRAIALE
jgi:hypothetical protein